MSILNDTIAALSITRIKDHFGSPLFRNAYALVFNIGATSGIGMLYWMLAARNYSTEVVGMNSAAISTMTFLANLSQFQLVNALNRFLPRAGRSTGRIILYAYLISVFVAFLSALIFLATLEIWSPELSPLRSNMTVSLWFILSTMAWSVFVLQDGAFIGLRQATWVPLENLIFAIGKVVLLIVFASLLPQFGVFASWTVPILLLILPTNLLIFVYLVPNHIQATKEDEESFSGSQVARFVIGDYISSIIWMGTRSLLPLMVIGMVGTSANAYYYLSWVIAYSLYLVSSYMGKSLIAEVSKDQSKLSSYSYRILVQNARIVVPVALVVVLAAPLLLKLFGEDYSAEGALLLRLLALSAIPNIITSLFVSIARVQRRMVAIILTLGAISVMVIALSYYLLGVIGISGVGIAWLVSQSVIALYLLVTELKMILLLHLDVSFLLGTLSGPRKWWRSLGNKRKVSEANGLLEIVLKDIDPRPTSSAPETWIVQRIYDTLNDTSVLTLGPPDEPETAILILPESPAAEKSNKQRAAVLNTLWGDERLENWRAYLPEVLSAGKIKHQAYQIEKKLPGMPANELPHDPDTYREVQVAAAAVIQKLHQLTASVVVVDDEKVERWVDEPLAKIQELDGALEPLSAKKEVFERIRSELWTALEGTTQSLSWVHGDLWPGNILISPDDLTVTGILDWEAAWPEEMPRLDILNLLISTRMILQGEELGEVIVKLVRHETWLPYEHALLDQSLAGTPGDRMDMRSMVLLHWLRHVSANLYKSNRYAKNKLWIAKNVEAVLECL